MIVLVYRRALDRLAGATRDRVGSMIGMDLLPLVHGLEQGTMKLVAWSGALVAIYLWSR